MFKYISDILKQFTPHQKMTALIVLLVAIISITYIESVTKTPEELKKQVSLQREAILKDQKYINDLSKVVSGLNDSILVGNQTCNERAMERERVFNRKMMEQQEYVNKTITEIQNIISSNKKFKKATVLKSIMPESTSQTIKADTIIKRTKIPLKTNVYKISSVEPKRKSIFSIFSPKREPIPEPIENKIEYYVKLDTIIKMDTVTNIKINKVEPETKSIQTEPDYTNKIVEKLNEIKKNVKNKHLPR